MTDATDITTARALWYAARGRAVLRDRPLGARKDGDVRVETLWSGLSRGTERLIFEGRVPASEHGRMRAPRQEGDFPFPVKYGYCTVGVVREGPGELLGRTVFALAPHETVFDAPADFVQPVPDHVPARRAILAANMETALNALWDGRAGPGDRIVVVGTGVVGSLVAALAARLPGAEVTPRRRRLVAPRPWRRRWAAASPKPLDSPGGADLVFHTSATSAGLSCALACAGDEATIVEICRGTARRPPSVSLGAAFHSGRLKLISSQVGRVSESRRGRWSYARRRRKRSPSSTTPVSTPS